MSETYFLIGHGLLSLGLFAALLITRKRLTHQRTLFIQKEAELKLIKDYGERSDNLKQELKTHMETLSSKWLNTSSKEMLERSDILLKHMRESTHGQLKSQQDVLAHLLKPFEKNLDHLKGQIKEMEEKRVGAYEGMTEQVKGLKDIHGHLAKETSQLVQSLKTPQMRGKWGEIQLRRLVEWTGMLPFCDFLTQESLETEEGNLRPDLLIQLPEQRFLVVDAKVPASLLVAPDNLSDKKKQSERLKMHIRHLSTKNYVQAAEKASYGTSPEFVLLFLPHESLLMHALEADPDLFDYGVTRSVLLVTPMTFVALLKVIFLGWRQKKMSEGAEEVYALSKELLEALRRILSGFQKLGSHFRGAVKTYNETMGLVEETVLVKSDQLADCSLADKGTSKSQLKVQSKEQSKAQGKVLRSVRLSGALGHDKRFEETVRG